MAGIQDASGANTAFVNTDLELSVALNKNPLKAGLAVVTGESHDGSLGLAAVRRAVRSSIDRSLNTTSLANLWDDSFNLTSINTRKYFISAATMTSVVASGAITLNSANSVTINQNYLFRTYKTFCLNGQGSLTLNFSWALALNIQANNNIEIGWGLTTVSSAAPSDGVYLSIDNAGAISLVANYNGGPTTTALLTGFTPVANKFYNTKIIVNRERTEAYIDDVLYAVINRSSANSVGALSINQNGNFHARLANTAATSGAQKLSISALSIVSTDYISSKKPATIASENLDMFVTTQDGPATSQIANITNSVAPVSATLSNTTAGYATLGGNFQFAAVAGSETDYALFAYQVPTMAFLSDNRSFIVTGIEIDTFNMGAAVATTPTLLNWYVGVGSSSTSLATGDSAGTKAYHKAFLGAQVLPIGTVVGGRADRNISVDFSESPLIVNPGELASIILRVPISTATVSQIVRGGATVKGYWA